MGHCLVAVIVHRGGQIFPLLDHVVSNHDREGITVATENLILRIREFILISNFLVLEFVLQSFQEASINPKFWMGRFIAEMESSKETGCRAREGPILCVNNCGFFGSAATMKLCSKCHKDMILKQEQAKLAATSIKNIVNRSSSSNGKEPVVAATIDVQSGSAELKVVSIETSADLASVHCSEMKPKECPSRCNTCRKRVGLTGFNCKCGNLFCAVHRYSEKHDCPFDYKNADRDAIAKANPVVVAEKLNKI